MMNQNRRRSSSVETTDLSDVRVGVVIPAGGSGQRMGIKRPKQFISVNGQTVLSHTVSGFASFPGVAVIVVVIQEDEEDLVTHELGDKTTQENDVILPPIVILPTASDISRHLTILSGVRELSKHGITLTVVHDAVRPIVPHKLLYCLLESASKYGAAGPVTPCVSTVVSVRDNSFLEDVLDRSKLRDSQMPQAFRSDLLLDAYETADEKDLLFGTECLFLVQKYINRGLNQSPRISFAGKGVPSIKLIQETDPNKLWKITHKKDVLMSVFALDPSFDVMMVNSVRVFIEAKEHHSLNKSMRSPHPHDVKLSPRCIFISRITKMCNSLFQDVAMKTFESGISPSFLSSPTNRDEPKTTSIVVRFASNLEQFRLQVRDLEACMDSLEGSSSQSCEDTLPHSLMLTVMELKEGSPAPLSSPMFSELNTMLTRARDKINFTFVIFFADTQVYAVRESVFAKQTSRETKLEKMMTMVLLKPEDFWHQILFIQ